MLNSDIALIQLPQPVEFTDVIQPISFACSSTNGMDVIAIGDGVTKSYNKNMSSILQYTELKTVSRLNCLWSHPYLIFRQSIICVKGEGHKSTCVGDSGGPLVTQDHSLIGLTSFGAFPCDFEAVTVFTRIAYYHEWIAEVTGVECKH